MPYPRPTLSELRQQVATDINAQLPGADALLRYSNLGIAGEVMAALASGHYGYLDWIARNSVPFTAIDEHLEGWAALKGVIRKAAAPASGAAAFVAADGAVIRAGTAVNRRDGVGYVVTADAVAAAGTITVQVRAIAPGVSGNASVGTAMTIAAGVAGVNASGSVSTELDGGSDVEPDDELRSRMLAVYANPPQGGTLTDFENWAREVPGVTRAWARRGVMGPGTVAVLFMMDVVRSELDGFPQGSNGVAADEARDVIATGDQLLVANALSRRQSVIALSYALAPMQNIVSLKIAGLAGSNAATRAAIAEAVRSAFVRHAEPGGTTYLYAIESAIASVPAATGFVLTEVTCTAGAVEPGPVGNVVSSLNALATLGSITYL